LQVAPVLVLVSQTFPHPPQFVTVLVCVSQPFTSVPVMSQLPQPDWQPVYVQLVPLQPVPTLCVVSHAFPHPPQLVIVLVGVSQPAVSGAVVMQFAHPPTHPV
jgi:hypothetical protein